MERAARLLEGKGIPLHFRGAVTALLDWLASLPKPVLDARPALWVRYAALLLTNGQTSGVEEKLQAAEAALQGIEPDDTTRDLVGRIATMRATLALARYQGEPMLAQSRRALEYLHPDNRSLRANANWTLGVAYNLQGNRAAARLAYTEAIALSQAAGNSFTTILGTIGLGDMQEADNQLYQAAETYQRVLHLAGDMPLPIACEAHLPLARICYEWNNLEAAEQHGQQSLHLARQYERGIDRFVLCEVFLARLKLARGDVVGAAALLAEAAQSARQHHFVARLPEIAAAQVPTFLRQGNVVAAARLADRLGLVAHMITLLTNIPLAVIFYDVFKVVNRRLAVLVVFFTLVGTAVEGANVLTQFAPLLLLGSGHSLSRTLAVPVAPRDGRERSQMGGAGERSGGVHPPRCAAVPTRAGPPDVLQLSLVVLLPNLEANHVLLIGWGKWSPPCGW